MEVRCILMVRRTFMMKKNILLFAPIIAIITVEVLAFVLAVQTTSQTPRNIATSFSTAVSLLMFVTGVLPALVKPQASHTLVACFTVVFAFFLLIPFELTDLPALRPGRPLYQFINIYLLLRLVNSAILLPMAAHVSARFPRSTGMSARTIIFGYLFSIALLIAFLFSSLPWQRIATISILFLWFTVVIIFFIRNLFIIARDTNPEHQLDAQRARVVLFSMILAEIPLWLRPLTLALGLDIFPYNLLLLFQLFVPIGIAYAVLRHDLFGIDRILRRTLVYGAVSLLLLTLYLFLTSSITSLFADSLTSRPLAPVISLLAAALLFEPTRKWIQIWLDKILYPDRLKFNSAIQSMQYLLGRANRREEIIHLLDDIFPNQIGAEWGALKLFPEPDVPPANLAPAWNIRLVAGSVSVGGYWLGARRAGPVYDADERNRLSALAGQAALALAYANAYESLYELNQNLEVRVKEQTAQAIADQKSIAAYEERQRIARDLHDGIVQSIYAAGMQLDVATLKKEIAPTDWPVVRTKVRSVADQLNRVITDIRKFIFNLGPIQAGEVDLYNFLKKTADQLASRDDIDARISITGNRIDLSAAQQQNLAFIVHEAISNVIKHASASKVFLGMDFQDDHILLEIEDNGVGIDLSGAHDHNGNGSLGLINMAQRAEAMGGQFSVSAGKAGRGTLVTVSIPSLETAKEDKDYARIQ